MPGRFPLYTDADVHGPLMQRIGFIKHASKLGIPYIDMTEEEWAAEMASLESL